jgi:hypothetical protein
MENQRAGESGSLTVDDKPLVHRMNLCIEVPAIVSPGIDPKASLVRFADMLEYIKALVERTKDDAKGEIGGARFSYSTEWATRPEMATVDAAA